MDCTAANSDIPGRMLRNSAFSASDAATAPNSNWAICSISLTARRPVLASISRALALTTRPSGPTSWRSVSMMKAGVSNQLSGRGDSDGP